MMSFKLTPSNKLAIEAARRLCEKEINPIADRIADKNYFSAGLLEKMARRKMLGLTVPEKYGGLDSSHLNSALISEELGKTGTGCFLSFSANNGVAEVLACWGSERIKQEIIPRLCDGSAYASCALTENGFEKDITRATWERDGGDVRLNGTKRLIISGDRPGRGLFFINDPGKRGKTIETTAVIVDKSSPGYSISGPVRLIGFEGAGIVDVHFNNVRVPGSHILGESGKGAGILLKWISGERFRQSAYMVGIGQAALTAAVNHAKGHIMNGRPVAHMQGVQWMLAEMKARVEAARSLFYRAACLQDDGDALDVVSAELRIFTVPAVQEVARTALQLIGAQGSSPAAPRYGCIGMPRRPLRQLRAWRRIKALPAWRW